MNLPTKATEVAPGVASATRIALLYYALPLGAALILGGLVGWFLGKSEAPLIIGSGVGLVTLALSAKVVQAHFEEAGGK